MLTTVATTGCKTQGEGGQNSEYPKKTDFDNFCGL